MYPIVKMAWAQGRTLAEFLESEHRNTQALQRLRQALAKMAAFLEQNQIAHGDIQPENVMVSADGCAVQLIDYDGVFVEAFRGSPATELGQINFQHPQRTAKDFNEKLDRFSFLTMDVALQALARSPSLWAVSRSEPSAVVFRRNDFLDPGSSVVFGEVRKLQGVAENAENLARVALGEFQNIPSLADFLQNKGISGRAITFKPKATSGVRAYQGAYPVCDATNYEQVFAQVGNRIELIGRVHSVRRGWGANKKPYVFVNFSDWRGKAVKLSIWSDGMNALGQNVPDNSWVGRWLSVTGLIDPPYRGQAKATSYMHLSITITAQGTIQQIPETEAQLRLRSVGSSSGMVGSTSRNGNILSAMSKEGSASSSAIRAVPRPLKPQQSSNQQLLERMRAQAPQPTRSTASKPLPSPSSPRPPVQRPANAPSQKSSSMDWLGWAIVVIGG